MNSLPRDSVEPPSRAEPEAPGAYLPAPLREALAVLRAGLAHDDPFLLLTGAPGSGKTTVARRLLHDLDPERFARGGIFGPYGSGEDALLHSVVHDFAVPAAGPGEAFVTLEQFLRRCDEADREAVLVLDEAQRLDAGGLRQLWQLAAPPAGGRPRMHVVLVAQQAPDAVAELVRSGRTPPIGTRCQLRRLLAAETHELVLQRMRDAGPGQPDFGADALDAIHQRSGGVPRRVALLCDRILMFLAMEGRREVDAPLVAAVDAQLSGEWRGPGWSPTGAEPKPAAPAATTHGRGALGDGGFAAARPLPAAAQAALGDAPAADRSAGPSRRRWGVLAALVGFGLVGALGLALPWLQPAAPVAPAPAAAGSVTVDQGAAAPAARPAVEAAAASAVEAPPVAAVAPVPTPTLGAEATPAAAPSPSPSPSLAPAPARATLPAPAPAAALPEPSAPARPAPRSVPSSTQAAAPEAAAAPAPPCTGAAQTLGLCAAAAAAPAVTAAPAAPTSARAEASPPASVSPRADKPACIAERAALGLCDSP